MNLTKIMGVTLGDTYTVVSDKRQLPLGYVGTVHVIRVNDLDTTPYEPSRVNIGLKADKFSNDYHDLEGYTQKGYGWWINLDALLNRSYFKPVNVKYVVMENFTFKGKNLKGLLCKPLCTSSKTEMWVEFENNIGGFCGDGQGKRGHCIPMDYRSLTKQTNEG